MNKELNSSSGFMRDTAVKIFGVESMKQLGTKSLNSVNQVKHGSTLALRHVRHEKQQRVNTDNQEPWYKSEQVRSVGS